MNLLFGFKLLFFIRFIGGIMSYVICSVILIVSDMLQSGEEGGEMLIMLGFFVVGFCLKGCEGLIFFFRGLFCFYFWKIGFRVGRFRRGLGRFFFFFVVFRRMSERDKKQYEEKFDVFVIKYFYGILLDMLRIRQFFVVFGVVLEEIKQIKRRNLFVCR